jgi:branched-chain amino acid transport system ATP-binding protein
MLTLENISAGYGGASVISHVTLRVPDSSVVALIGANGAGKTTLLRVVSGELSPSAGRVVLDGVDLTNASPNARAAAGLCYVPEGHSIFPSLTVQENLGLFAGRRAGAGASIDRVLHGFPKLGQRLRQGAGTMSGGEQQMLAMARAFLSDPKVVLLDEASMGLAPKIVDEIFESLERLAATGVSLLVVEQYVAKVTSIADYVCVLAQGRLSFVGEPAEVDRMDLAEAYLGRR